MKAIMALALIAPLAACATITRGTTQAFTVESDPAGATVEMSNGMHCDATPCTFARIPRNAEFTVTVSKEGYRTSTHSVTHQVSGGGAAGMAGNVVVGGIIGMVVDGSSGAMNDLVPNPLHVTLESADGAMVADAAPAAGATTEAAPAAPQPAPASPSN